MSIFQRKQNKKVNNIEERSTESWNPLYGTLSFNSYSSYSQSKALKLSTVYRCVNLISDSIASLPFNPYFYKDNWKYINYDSTLYNLLNVQPNPYIGKFNFMKLVVTSMILKGNAYILIDRAKTGEVLSLMLLPAGNIEIKLDKNDIKYYDKFNKKTYDKSQIIHILNYTNDGLVGVSTLEYAATQLVIDYDTDQHSSNFLKGGANLDGILRPLEGVFIKGDKAKKDKSDFI
jgi:HK97 family phage portal protein